ncbi:MAG: hypothetical protein WDZ91_11915 [Paenibacillaceae bacterium]
MAILLWLISLIISIMILYWIIISAINSSVMARDIKELKEILINQYSIKPVDYEQNTEIIDHDNHSQSNGVRNEAIQEECPACGGKVLSIDQVCGSCGLTLIVKGDM